MMSMKEIARMCGTSVATVSRVLNNPDYKCADPKLKERIWTIAGKYDYVPNEAARDLKMSKSRAEKVHHINIMLTRIGGDETDPFYNELLGNVTTELHQHLCVMSNLWYMPYFAPDKKYGKKEIHDNLEKMLDQSQEKMDGLIIMGKCKREVLEILQNKFKGIVMIVRNHADYGVDEVLLDGNQVASTALEYLISMGHKKIGYIGDCTFDECFTGYMHTMKMHQLDINIDYIVEAPRSEDGGYAAMDQILGMSDRPTAIFCLVDAIAIGALKRLNKRKNKLYTPSIIACDGIEEGKYTSPMLTTVESPKEDMARLAVLLLLNRLEKGHKSSARVVVDGKLVIRESCKRVSEAEDSIEYYI
ncbi:MAG: LacI family transcriptional regulator [Clostridia bacterium]|nr:LacI family transcriptional regulator [Clostridia bacterium]